MKGPELPTPEQLARLAAIVLPQCKATVIEDLSNPLEPGERKKSSQEQEAVRLAARLWYYAAEFCEELAKDPSQDWALAGDKRKATDRAIKKYFATLLRIGSNEENSSAYQWFQTQVAKTKLDKSLSYSRFIDALKKFDLPDKFDISKDQLNQLPALLTHERSLARQIRRKKNRK